MAEISDELWDVARKLGHSREEVEGMLEKRTPSDVLRRLKGRLGRITHRLEREDKVRWTNSESEKRREVYEQERVLIAAMKKQQRREMSLAERVGKVLAEATVVQEQTQGSSVNPRVSTGERDAGIPRLHAQPLVEELEELIVAVVERAEMELDRVQCNLPRRDRDELNSEILKASGTPEIVAIRFAVSESHVRKLRAAHQRERQVAA